MKKIIILLSFIMISIACYGQIDAPFGIVIGDSTTGSYVARVDSFTLSPTDTAFYSRGRRIAVGASVSGGGAGASAFLDLTDTPGAFTALYLTRVNAGGTALEWLNPATYNITNFLLQTTLSGYTISDSKTNFNTALSDGSFLFVGDAPTAHAASHEVGGGDLVSHDDLTDFAENEHRIWEITGAQDIHADRISEASITQHEAAIDHDGLTNFTTNEHFLQSAISIPASQISDFDTEVSNNTDVASNTSHTGTTTGNPHSIDFSDLGTSTHASSHEVGGADLVSHDALTNFVAAEHYDLSGDTHEWTTTDDINADSIKADYGAFDEGVLFGVASPTNARCDSLHITATDSILYVTVGVTQYAIDLNASGGGGGGSSTFLGLTDTPGNYTDKGLEFLRINEAENAVESAVVDTLAQGDIDVDGFNGALTADGTPTNTQYAQWTSDTTLQGISSIPWSGISSTPTTFAGYGVADNEVGLYSVLSDVTNFLQTGDAVAGGDITDNTILEPSLSSTNAPTDNYVLSYNLAGTNFTWVVDATGGAPATADISDVNVEQTELAELETIGVTVIEAADWTAVAAMSGVNTGDDAGIDATTGTVNGVTLTDDGSTATLGGTLAINNSDWSGTDLEDANVADDITITNISQVADISASASEINTPLDGASVTLTEFQELETIGATTISANQWTAIGGMAETLTSTELDYVDGVTSAIQTQFGAKYDTSDLKLDVWLIQDTVVLASFNASDSLNTSFFYGSFYNGGSDTLVVTKMIAVLQGSSPSVAVDIEWHATFASGSAVGLNNTPPTITSTTTGDSDTSFDNDQIPPGVFVWCKTPTVTTEPTYMSVTLLGHRLNRSY